MPTPPRRVLATRRHVLGSLPPLLLLLPLGVLAKPKTSPEPPGAACPPSCATNELLDLLDQYCSDKGEREMLRAA